MKPLYLFLFLLPLLAGCGSVGRPLTGAALGAGGAYLGHTLSDGDPLATAGGAAGGVLVSEGLHALGSAQQRTDDLWHAGELIVPTGTEVHGRANADRMRERIVAEGEWTLVWQDGRQLALTGIALDREEHPSLLTWGMTDGSAGLRGQVLHSDVLAEVKLFLATFMSGMAASLQQNGTTRFGVPLPVSARDAALTGTSEVLNRYAEELAEIVRRDGIYIRVPGGKQMYLYVTQAIDLSRVRTGPGPSEPPSIATATPQSESTTP